MKLTAYLTFNGNCRQAMKFYRECFGGELTFQLVGDAPASAQLPVDFKNLVLTATLLQDNLTLIATDLSGEQKLVNGNRVSLFVSCTSKKEIEGLYKKLSKNSRISHPVSLTYYNCLRGDIVDQFGNAWVLQYSKNEDN